jgi:hypothetical protein
VDDRWLSSILTDRHGRPHPMRSRGAKIGVSSWLGAQWEGPPLRIVAQNDISMVDDLPSHFKGQVLPHSAWNSDGQGKSYMARWCLRCCTYSMVRMGGYVARTTRSLGVGRRRCSREIYIKVSTQRSAARVIAWCRNILEWSTQGGYGYFGWDFLCTPPNKKYC